MRTYLFKRNLQICIMAICIAIACSVLVLKPETALAQSGRLPTPTMYTPTFNENFRLFTADWSYVSGTGEYHVHYFDDGQAFAHTAVQHPTTSETIDIGNRTGVICVSVLAASAGRDSYRSAKNCVYIPLHASRLPTPTMQSVRFNEINENFPLVTAYWSFVSGTGEYHVHYFDDGDAFAYTAVQHPTTSETINIGNRTGEICVSVLAAGGPGDSYRSARKCVTVPDRSCEEDLTCTIEYIEGLTLTQRTTWFNTSIVQRYGASVGFATAEGNWFANIESVLEIAPGKFEGNPAFELIDSFILKAVQDGLRLHLTGNLNIDPEYGEILGARRWAQFFDSLQGNDYNEQRRNWGIAEQLATNHGREAAAANGWRLDDNTHRLLISIGDDYRRLVAHPDEAVIAMLPAGTLTCSTGMGEPSYSCAQNWAEFYAEGFDPRNPGTLFSDIANVIWWDIGIVDVVANAIINLNGEWDWPCAEPDVSYCGNVPNGH